MSMKWISCILFSFILLQSAVFAEEADKLIASNTDSSIGNNIFWINGDIGIVWQTEYQLSDHIIQPEEKKRPYYSLGFAYDYRYDEHGFIHSGVNISKYEIEFSQTEEGVGTDFTTYKSDLLTFDPSIGLRFVSVNLFSELRVFFDFGIYMSIISVNTDVDNNSGTEKFYDDTNFGVYTGIGTLYKFNDKICTSLSFNLKWPANNQSVSNSDEIYEAEAAEYHPLFLYASFSIGYMF